MGMENSFIEIISQFFSSLLQLEDSAIITIIIFLVIVIIVLKILSKISKIIQILLGIGVLILILAWILK